jgi:hypothetical protein
MKRGRQRSFARFGSGFGTADNRGSRRRSQYILLGGGIDLLGGNLSGEGEERRREPQQHFAKRNKYLRRVLNQAAHAAVKKKGSHFQAVFRRVLPRLGYQAAIWAIAHRLCRARALRRLGCDVAITPTKAASQNGMRV